MVILLNKDGNLAAASSVALSISSALKPLTASRIWPSALARAASSINRPFVAGFIHKLLFSLPSLFSIRSLIASKRSWLAANKAFTFFYLLFHLIFLGFQMLEGGFNIASLSAQKIHQRFTGKFEEKSHHNHEIDPIA